jgi:hypothetical protein
MKRKAKPLITKPPKYFNGPWVFPVPGNLEFFIDRDEAKVKQDIDEEQDRSPIIELIRYS